MAEDLTQLQSDLTAVRATIRSIVDGEIREAASPDGSSFTHLSLEQLEARESRLIAQINRAKRKTRGPGRIRNRGIY